MEILYRPIGTIYTPFYSIEEMPIQPSGAIGIKGRVEIAPRYVDALKDLEGFSHVILLYHFHEVNNWEPLVTPFLDDQAHGLFATRAPKRPNPIGLSIVRLLGISEGILEVENVDMLNGTPLLDIKPYAPAFDQFEVTSLGWLEKNSKRVKSQRSDDRFG